ncbi:fructoselysine 6-kinase [Bacillus sp. FJAT-49736]|uniref:fructoselysine 6-kinase n=1 Tax=Bacillus sp. FJAT-49736 TaxID=2833582 RepID=UPI001BCA0F6F|nr:fructoselysine 6-kinase [Bacillus sp. FJAT-49736]MBS4172788.1 fructoselysine 6-kinase [Bacillus sp. FJAT-49736]
MKFIGIGDNCIDCYIQTGEKYAGGNAVNFTVYISELGGEAAYLGVVGNDENGMLIINGLNNKGIDTSHIEIASGKTAKTEITLTNGDRSMANYQEGVFEFFTIDRKGLEYIKGHQFVHTATWGRCDTYLKDLHGNTVISYDFADQHELEKMKSIAMYIDYAFISYKEDDEYVRNILVKLHQYGSKVAVATLGQNGSLAYDGCQFYKYGIEDVNVVDTLGAGDSYIAGFMFGIANRATISDAMKLGAVRASKTIQYFGAWHA